jgi:hypothetical protein
VDENANADFEVRAGGMVVAAASGPYQRSLSEAMNYFRQYSFDATEDEPVELVQVVVVLSTDPR